jgi:hypothetical protein
MALLTLPRPSLRRLNHSHALHVEARIRGYRVAARRALQEAQFARHRGQGPLAKGLLETALTYSAMAQGLIEQHNTGGI